MKKLILVHDTINTYTYGFDHNFNYLHGSEDEWTNGIIESFEQFGIIVENMTLDELGIKSDHPAEDISPIIKSTLKKLSLKNKMNEEFGKKKTL